MIVRSAIYGSDHGELIDIFVDEKARRQGVARAMVAAVVTALEELGAPQIVLGVATKNPHAQRLFESVGFRATMTEMTLRAAPKKPARERPAPSPKTPKKRVAPKK